MFKRRSHLLAFFAVLLLLMMPLFHLIVSNQLEKQIEDDALLKRITFIGGSVQRFIKHPDHAQSLIYDIDEAFASAEAIYPALIKPDPLEKELARDYFIFKSCWESIKQQSSSEPELLKKEGEMCWIRANKTVFDLYYVVEQKRKQLLDYLFTLGIFGSLLLTFLLYQIYRYVHIELEKNLKIDLQTGLFNLDAFLDECTRNCTSSLRNNTPLCVVLIKFSDQKSCKNSAKKIVELLQSSCRREEKLFRLSEAQYALITLHTSIDELSPLIDRLEKNLSTQKNLFGIGMLEYSNDIEAEAFGPACIEALANVEIRTRRTGDAI